MLNIFLLILLHIITFVNTICTFLWRLSISTVQSTQTSARILYKLKIEISLCLLLFFVGLPLNEFQSEVQSGTSLIYECGLSPAFQGLQSFTYKFVRVPQMYVVEKTNDLVMYLRDSVIDTYHELIAIEKIASMEGVQEVISILWDEYKVFATALFTRPTFQIEYFSNIVLNLQQTAFCYTEVTGSILGSLLDGTIVAQNCEVCHLDPGQLCPISKGGTIFGLSADVFPTPNCNECRDPIGDAFTCTANFINFVSDNNYNFYVDNITGSIACIINQVVIPPIFTLIGLICNCLTSDIVNYIENWFQGFIACFDGFIEIITGGRFTSFWQIFFRYIFPLIQALIDAIEALIICEQDSEFVACLDSWPSGNANDCSPDYCGYCVTDYTGKVTQGLSTCFTKNAQCVSAIEFFEPIKPVIMIFPDIIAAIDYVVCPFSSLVTCFSPTYTYYNCRGMNDLDSFNCQLTCVKNNVVVFSPFATVLSSVVSAISSVQSSVVNSVNAISRQINDIWNTIEDLPEKAWEYIKDKLDITRDQQTHEHEYEYNPNIPSDRFFPNGTYNHFRRVWPIPLVVIYHNRTFNDTAFEIYLNQTEAFDSNVSYSVTKRYNELNSMFENYKESRSEGRTESLFRQAFNYFYIPIKNSTYFTIAKEFYQDYTTWKSLYIDNTTSNTIIQRDRILSLDEQYKEAIFNQTRDEHLQHIYLEHVNRWLYHYEQSKEEYIRNRIQSNITSGCKDSSCRFLSSNMNSSRKKSVIVRESEFSGLSSIMLYEPIANVRDLPEMINQTNTVINRLRTKSETFKKVWDVLEKNMGIEHNPTFQTLHMVTSSIRDGKYTELADYIQGRKFYLVNEGFVSPKRYESAMENKNRRRDGSIINIIQGTNNPLKRGDKLKYGPFLSSFGEYNLTKISLDNLKNEILRSRQLKLSRTHSLDDSKSIEDANNLKRSESIRRKRSNEQQQTSIDYNEMAIDTIENVISYIRNINNTGFKDAVTNIKNVFEDYNYSSLEDRIVNRIEDYFTVVLPEDINGVNQYNPWSFPLFPTDMFSVLQVEPNSNIPLQIPWPSDFISKNCTKVFNGNSDLFHFALSDNCGLNDGPYCPVCDYCPREYDNECKDLGFKDFLDSLFFFFSAFPRIVDTVYTEGIDIKWLTPIVITLVAVIGVLALNVFGLFIVPVLTLFIYFVLYTISFFFHGMIPYGFFILILLILLFIFASQLQTWFVLTSSIGVLFGFTWVASQFVTFPSIAAYLNINHWLLYLVVSYEQYLGFTNTINSELLKSKLERFIYDPTQDIPFTDKYCFVWTFGNVFFGFFMLFPIAATTIYTANYVFDILLLQISLIQQVIQFFRDVRNINASELQNRLVSWKTITQARVFSLSKRAKDMAMNKYNGISNTLRYKYYGRHKERPSPAIGRRINHDTDDDEYINMEEEEEQQRQHQRTNFSAPNRLIMRPNGMNSTKRYNITPYLTQ